jgi:hypothetical protein
MKEMENQMREHERELNCRELIGTDENEKELQLKGGFPWRVEGGDVEREDIDKYR